MEATIEEILNTVNGVETESHNGHEYTVVGVPPPLPSPSSTLEKAIEHDQAVVEDNSVAIVKKESPTLIVACSVDVQQTEKKRRRAELQNMNRDDFEKRMNAYAVTSLGRLYGSKNIIASLNDVKKMRLSMSTMSFVVNNTKVTDIILAPNRSTLLMLGPMSCTGILHNKSTIVNEMEAMGCAFPETLKPNLPLMQQLEQNPQMTTYMYCPHDNNVNVNIDDKYTLGYTTMLEVFEYLTERAEQQFKDKAGKLRELRARLRERFSQGIKLGNHADLKNIHFSNIDADLVVTRTSPDDLWPASAHTFFVVAQFPVLRFSMSGASFHWKAKQVLKLSDEFKPPITECFDFASGSPIYQGDFVSNELENLLQSIENAADSSPPLKKIKH